MSTSNGDGASLTSELAQLILIANEGNSSLVINTGDKPALFIDTDTKIGINTLTPAAQLDIASDDGTCLCLRYGESQTAFANMAMTIDGDLEISPMTVGSKIKTSGSIDIVNHNGSSVGLKLAGELVSTTAAQLNYNAVTAGTAEANRALVLNGAKAISGITSLTTTSMYGTIKTGEQPFITSVGTLSSLSVAGSMSAASLVGTLQTAAQPNITSVGTLSSLSVAGSMSAASLIGTLQTSAQPNITSIGALTSISIAGSSIASEAAFLSGAVAGTAANSKALVLSSGGAISGIQSLTSTSLTGTLTSGSQPNITAVGTLSSLTVTNGITASTLTGTLQTATQPNITSVGALTTISIAGSTIGTEAAYLSGVNAGTASASKVVVLSADKGISGIGAFSASTLTGTLQTAAQPNITSIGALGSITIAGALIGAEAAYLSGATAGSAAASKALVLNASGAISGIQSLSATNLAGALQTAAQPNVTSVGTLTALTVSGSVSLTSTSDASTAESGGALTISGGLAVAKKMYVGTSLYVAGSVYINGQQVTNADPNGYLQVTPGTAANSKALVLGSTGSISGINNLSATSVTVGGVAVSSSNLAYLTDITAGTASASKALVVDGTKAISGIESLNATSIIGTLQTGAQPNITSVGTLSSAPVVSFSTSGASLVSYQTWRNNSGSTMIVGLGMSSNAAMFGTTTSNKMHFMANGASSMVLQTSGNVSIGHDVDTYKLSVNGTINATSFYLNGSALDFSNLSLIAGITAGTASADKALIVNSDRSISNINSLSASSLSLGSNTLTATEAGYLTSITAGSATAAKAVILDGSKNIAGIGSLSATTLIGTISTAAQTSITSIGTLTGLSTSGAIATTINNNTVTSSSYQSWTNSLTTPMVIDLTMNNASPSFGTTSAHKFRLQSNGTDALIIQSSGNVSIGSDVDTYKLSIAGSLNAASFSLSGTVIDLTLISGITAGTASASKAVILDGSKGITGIGDIGVSAVAATSLSVAASSNTSCTITNASPSSSANVRCVSDTYTGEFGIQGSSATYANTMYLSYNSQPRLLINTSGEVAVGTTTFGYGLNVGGSINATSYRLNGTAFDPTLITGVTAGTATASKVVILDSGKSITGIATLSATTLNGTIGTAAQTNITSVGTLTGLSTSGAIATSINNDTTTGVSYQSWTNTLATSMTVGLRMNNSSPAFGTTSNHKFRLQSNGTDAVFIQASGNVSIGSDVDTYKLNVNGSINATQLYVNGSPFNASSSEYVDGTTAGTATASKALILDANKAIVGMGNLKFGSTSRPFVEGSELGGASYVANWGAGTRWGIGQHASGSLTAVRIGGCDTDGTWNTVYPSLYAGAFSAMSDHRLKENFRELPYGLETIKQLRPLMYDLKCNSTTDQMGFIAHEIQEVIPSVVTGTKDAVDAYGKEVHQSVSYTSLVPVAIKAIQDLAKKNEELVQKNAFLEEQLTLVLERLMILEQK